MATPLTITPFTVASVIGVDDRTYEKLNSTKYYITSSSNSTNYYGNVNIPCLGVKSGNIISSFTNTGIILGGGGAGGNGNNDNTDGIDGKSAFVNEGTIIDFKNSGALLGGGGAGGRSRTTILTPFSLDIAAVGGAGGGGGGNYGNSPSCGNGGSIIGHYALDLSTTGGKALTQNGSVNTANVSGGGGGPGGKGGGSNGGTGGGAPGGYGGNIYGNGYSCPSSIFTYGGGGGAGASGSSTPYGGGGGGYGGGNGGSGNIIGLGSGGGGGGGGLPGTPGGNINPGGMGGYSIDNQGTINTLRNAQGGTGYLYGPLFYTGYLPAHYYIIINSASSYGQIYGNLTTSSSSSLSISTLSHFDIDPDSAMSFTDSIITLKQVIYGYNVDSNSLLGTFISSNNIYKWQLVPNNNVGYTLSNGNSANNINISSTIAYDLQISLNSFDTWINNVNSPPIYNTLTGSYNNFTLGISNSSLIRSDTTSLYLNNVLVGITPAVFNGTFVSNGNTYAWQLLVVPNSDPIRYNLVIILASMLSGIYINNIDFAFLFKTSS